MKINKKVNAFIEKDFFDPEFFYQRSYCPSHLLSRAFRNGSELFLHSLFGRTLAVGEAGQDIQSARGRRRNLWADDAKASTAPARTAHTRATCFSGYATLISGFSKSYEAVGAAAVDLISSSFRTTHAASPKIGEPSYSTHSGLKAAQYALWYA